jgi:hypothetical protein
MNGVAPRHEGDEAGHVAPRHVTAQGVVQVLQSRV